MIVVKRKQPVKQQSGISERRVTPLKLCKATKPRQNTPVIYNPEPTRSSFRTKTQQQKEFAIPATHLALLPHQKCRNHEERAAIFQVYLVEGIERYCQRCAVSFAAQGYRVIKLGSVMSALKHQLEESMEREVGKARTTFKRAITELENELKSVEESIRSRYSMALQECLKGCRVVQLLEFKQSKTKLTAPKIKEIVGRLESIEIELPSEQPKPIESRTMTKPLTLNLTKSRARLNSHRSYKPKPAQIYIQLCGESRKTEQQLQQGSHSYRLQCL